MLEKAWKLLNSANRGHIAELLLFLLDVLLAPTALCLVSLLLMNACLVPEGTIVLELDLVRQLDHAMEAIFVQVVPKLQILLRFQAMSVQWVFSARLVLLKRFRVLLVLMLFLEVLLRLINVSPVHQAIIALNLQCWLMK